MTLFRSRRSKELPPLVDRPLANTYWVLPHRLLAGEYPGAADEASTLPRLARLRAAGVDSFFDLTEEYEMEPYRQFLPPQIEHHRWPIMDASIPNNISQTRSVLEAMRDALERGRSVYVHCQAGIGRTGLIVGCFLAEEEASGRRALKRLNRLWQQSERSKIWRSIPQTTQQADYVRRWHSLKQNAS